MQFHLSGSQPVYQQIIEQFRDAVLAGEYPPGARVPSVRELAAQARVNPNTMQRALVQLEQEALLVGCGTTGRHVTEDEQVLAELRKSAVSAIVREYRKRLEDLGVPLEEAAKRLLEEE